MRKPAQRRPSGRRTARTDANAHRSPGHTLRKSENCASVPGSRPPPAKILRSDLREARAWLLENAHGTHVRHLLERGLEYAEAVEQAGLSLEMVEGDDLYQFLADPRTATARTERLHGPTL